jgi:hypothetical protein
MDTINLLSRPLRAVGKVLPASLWYLYYLQCFRIGARSSKYLLTFDCDTDLDIKVVSGVHAKLSAMGITPVYAVPGQLIERGLDTYKALSDLGAEFLNHGYVQHTTVDTQRMKYLSTFFYDEIGEKEALSDIERGHETLVEKLGITPQGFRTPHFGTFQSKENLLFLHEKLRSLGYILSSSTSPRYSFVKGPHFDNDGIIEIPVTGCPSWPLGILDSFNFRFSGSTKFTPQVFESEMKKAFDMMEAGRLKRINMYADPSQVYDWEGFFVSVSRFAPFAVASFSSYLEE